MSNLAPNVRMALGLIRLKMERGIGHPFAIFSPLVTAVTNSDRLTWNLRVTQSIP